MFPHRTWMFVPGDRPRMIEKAIGLGALDALILDLEDSVILQQKPVARSNVAEALDGASTGPAIYVRINASDQVDMADELGAVVRSGLAGLMLPKVQSPKCIEDLEPMLLEMEEHANMEAGSVGIVATIESARGIIHAPAIAEASPRMTALMLGSEDLALDLGITSGTDGCPDDMVYARSATVVAAASAGLQSIDRIVPNIEDGARQERDARQGRGLGFTGKAVIHPRQIDIVRRCFVPSDAEIAHARRVIDVYDEAESSGSGAVSLDGQLVDRPIAEQARRLLNEAGRDQ
jgi:citrate lyase subunit beta / citryl-CoA lyase